MSEGPTARNTLTVPVIAGMNTLALAWTLDVQFQCLFVWNDASCRLASIKKWIVADASRVIKKPIALHGRVSTISEHIPMN